MGGQPVLQYRQQLTRPDCLDKNEGATGGKSRRKAVFAYLGSRIMANPVALRTRIYVDGYNLYYGCLKGTAYKWLDLRSLFDQVLATILFAPDGDPLQFGLQVPSIKYFTAPINKNFAKADDSVSSQAQYHNALRGHLGDGIRIVEGYYDARRIWQHAYQKGRPPRKSDKIEVWKLEEKQSDVALSLHAYSDALRGEVDHVIVVSNDTDIVPALAMIREHTRATIGLVVPTRDRVRPVNQALSDLAHWTRSHLLDSELEAAQLPAMVRHEQKAVHKPLSWYPRADLLAPIFAEAKRVKRSAGAAWKWLHTPSEPLGGRLPIEMAATDEGAAELRAYMAKYAEDFGI